MFRTRCESRRPLTRPPSIASNHVNCRTPAQEVEETVTKDEVEPTTATTEAGDAATAAPATTVPEASTETTAAPAQSVEETPATTAEEVKDKVESLKSTEPVTTGKSSLSKPLDRSGQTLTRARP
jgi:3-oxoacyl-ACP reductase-like protein